MAHYSKIFVAVDAVVFRLGVALEILLIRRAIQPFLGSYALPGGHLEEEEDPESGIRRELIEESGLLNVHLEPLMFYGDPKRDPRYRIISLSYWGLTKGLDALHAATDADDARWFNIKDLPAVCFDHKQIIDDAIIKLRHELFWTSKITHLIGDAFTLPELERAYQMIFDEPFDKRNFRRKLNSMGLLAPVERNAKRSLYKFKGL